MILFLHFVAFSIFTSHPASAKESLPELLEIDGCQSKLSKGVSLNKEQERTVFKAMARFGSFLMRGTYARSQKITRISEVEGKLHIYVTLFFKRKTVYTVAVMDPATEKIEQLIGPSMNGKYAQTYTPF